MYKLKVKNTVEKSKWGEVKYLSNILLCKVQ